MDFLGLPKQKLPIGQKSENWGIENVEYFRKIAYTSPTGNRTSNARKLINYDLFNGRFNRKDLEYVCNPFGTNTQQMEFPANLQHYDIISPAIMLLLGEEIKRPDNAKVIAEDSDSISRKERILKEKISYLLKEQLLQEINPEETDPNNPPLQIEEILKYEKYSSSDMIEVTANKILSYLKRNLNTKTLFNRGWKDALIAGEELYWVGISNGEPTMRRCNPPDIAVVLDGDSDFVDDAVAVIETRMLHISTILDEYGDDLKPGQVSKLEELQRSSLRTDKGYAPILIPNPDGTEPGFGNYTNSYRTELGSSVNGYIKVVRVEWMSLKKVGILTYKDENGVEQEQLVDEIFRLDDDMKGEGYEVEWFWINEAWEGVKIGSDIYTAIRPKQNQRRRLDNPYYCRLGYSGLIYNATNSTSVSLIDRMKPYQYLYNILMYRLELAFASDMGKIFLMDLAQVPKSEGMNLDQWMYYLKAMKIGFINSHEEGKRGSRTGQVSNFNQFQSIDMSLSNTIQQYINSLEYIKQQVFFLTGISPQRLGEVQASELVGNVQNAVSQSANITEYWFEAHNEVKRRVYTGLIECAKIAWRDGKKVQYVLDDLGIEILNIDGADIENSEFNVFMSVSLKDQEVINTLKSLFQSALQSDKATLSDIANVISKDSTQEIAKLLEQREKEKQQRMEAQQQQLNEIEQSKVEMQKQITDQQLADKQADRDLKQYEIDTNNQTKIQVAEISALSFAKDTDQDDNGIPDVMEQANLSLKERQQQSKEFIENQKVTHKRELEDKKLAIKEKEMKDKKEIENLKIKQTEIQNASQEKMQKKQLEMKEKELQLKKQALKQKPKTKK